MTTNGAFTCDTCRKRFRGEPVRSMTGRELCQDCADTLTGLAAGMLAGGGAGAEAGSSQQIGQAIATAGWFSRMRALRKARRNPPR